ncbi:hypothetical protein [Alicyclobacillus dauci]|uniref:Uncharacterized protein n=1 Tax=Alicyclobacillus dauci TaxID=1475485 RepID=A0ABY6YWV1_9BACL|nr:hypothetical protein [Alicyclobacillus dauci]WAH35018.1 hypothetical protein NZD86_11830 [Alicyclobacillus dauci]
MTPPPEVTQWLKANNMRAISTLKYLELMKENSSLQKRIERVQKHYEAVLAK